MHQQVNSKRGDQLNYVAKDVKENECAIGVDNQHHEQNMHQQRNSERGEQQEQLVVDVVVGVGGDELVQQRRCGQVMQLRRLLGSGEKARIQPYPRTSRY